MVKIVESNRKIKAFVLCKNQEYLVLMFRDSILFQADGWSGVGDLTHIKLDPSMKHDWPGRKQWKSPKLGLLVGRVGIGGLGKAWAEIKTEWWENDYIQRQAPLRMDVQSSFTCEDWSLSCCQVWRTQPGTPELIWESWKRAGSQEM